MPALGSPLLQVMFDIVLAGEVWNVRRIRVRFLSTPVSGGVDEDLHAMGYCFIHQVFSLLCFTLLGYASVYSMLHAENTPDGSAIGSFNSSFEASGYIVQVPFHQSDGRQFRGEGLGRRRARVASQGDDGEQ